MKETGTLGERLRLARRFRGLTLVDLGRKAGVSRVSLWDIERGRRGATLRLLKKIATALEVGCWWLMTGEQPWWPPSGWTATHRWTCPLCGAPEKPKTRGGG